MSRSITAHTRLLAILGNPVRHSLSPTFQNAAIREAGLDAVYLALPCDPDALPGLLRGIAAAGGAGNVTVPHKRAAAEAVDHPTDAVLATRACNTFWQESDGLHGDNTDVTGFVGAAESLLRAPLGGSRVLVLGAGGAASAVVFGLVEAGASEVVIANRSPARGEELADRYRATSGSLVRSARLEDVRGDSFDLVVNATSLGLRAEDPPPLPDAGAPRFEAALDLVYDPTRTAWVNRLRDRGVRAEDGLEMLLLQGAASFERWFGIDAPVEAMRASLPPR